MGSSVASRSHRLPDAQLDVHTHEPSELVVQALPFAVKGAAAPRSDSATSSARADASLRGYHLVAIVGLQSFDAWEFGSNIT